MKFSKKDFQKKYKPEEVEELYDPKTGEIGGDTVVTHNQVRVDTPVLPTDDTTDREQDIPQDTEKYAAQAKNTSADMGRSRFNMGTAYGYVREDEEEINDIKESIKGKSRKAVKEMLNNKSNDGEIVSNELSLNSKRDELITILKNMKDPKKVQKVVDDIANALEDNTPSNNL